MYAEALKCVHSNKSVLGNSVLHIAVCVCVCVCVCLLRYDTVQLTSLFWQLFQHTTDISGNFRGFKISWIDQNKSVNHINFLIFVHYFSQTTKSTKFNSHGKFPIR